MEVEEKNKRRVFYFKTVLTIVGCLLLVVTGIRFIPDAVTVSSNSTGKELPIYCVDRQDVKVTFFMTGGWIEKYPDDVKAIASAGHDLGNHSENHKQMSTLSKNNLKKKL